MPSRADVHASFHQGIKRLSNAHTHEVRAVCSGFCGFFCVLGSYFLLVPLRYVGVTYYDRPNVEARFPCKSPVLAKTSTGRSAFTPYMLQHILHRREEAAVTLGESFSYHPDTPTLNTM